MAVQISTQYQVVAVGWDAPSPKGALGKGQASKRSHEQSGFRAAVSMCATPRTREGAAFLGVHGVVFRIFELRGLSRKLAFRSPRPRGPRLQHPTCLSDDGIDDDAGVGAPGGGRGLGDVVVEQGAFQIRLRCQITESPARRQSYNTSCWRWLFIVERKAQSWLLSLIKSKRCSMVLKT